MLIEPQVPPLRCAPVGMTKQPVMFTPNIMLTRRPRPERDPEDHRRGVDQRARQADGQRDFPRFGRGGSQDPQRRSSRTFTFTKWARPTPSSTLSARRSARRRSESINSSARRSTSAAERLLAPTASCRSPRRRPWSCCKVCRFTPATFRRSWSRRPAPRS